MNLISDPELIKALYAWEAQINLVEKRQGFVNEWNMDFVHLLTDYVSFKEMDAQGGYPWTGASRLETKIVELFHRARPSIVPVRFHPFGRGCHRPVRFIRGPGRFPAAPRGPCSGRAA